jgi:hypothetical protein
LRAAGIERMGSKADFFGMKPIARLDVTRGSEVTSGAFPRSISMAFRPFVDKLSVVTAYIAFAFVGAIVLGVF